MQVLKSLYCLDYERFYFYQTIRAIKKNCKDKSSVDHFDFEMSKKGTASETKCNSENIYQFDFLHMMTKRGLH